MRFAHLDTGAMYRAITAKAIAEGIDPTDERALAGLARATEIDFGPKGMTIDGEPPGRTLRTRTVSRWVSTVSAHRTVRRELVRIQRQILSKGEIVAEGRDIGTVVCPNAAVKVYLTASVDERARRRHKEMEEAGEAVPFETLRTEIRKRDRLDSTRSISPLAPAQDAVVVDSTGKTPRQVVAEIVALAVARRPSR